MSDLIEVEFTEASGLRETTDPIVTIAEAKVYRDAGLLVIPESDGKALTKDDFLGADYDN